MSFLFAQTVAFDESLPQKPSGLVTNSTQSLPGPLNQALSSTSTQSRVNLKFQIVDIDFIQF